MIRRDSAIAQGDVLNATETTISLSKDDAAFNFQVNGKYLDGTSTNTSAAQTNAISYDASQPFDSSTLKGNLDTLMTTLNAAHGSNVFEYSVSGRDITFFQRDGGEVNIGGFVTGANSIKAREGEDQVGGFDFMLKQYCIDNPIETLSGASAELYRQLEELENN